MPLAGEDAILRFQIPYWSPEVTADVGDRLQSAFVLIEENIVITNPAGQLAAGTLQFLTCREEVVDHLGTSFGRCDHF